MSEGQRWLDVSTELTAGLTRAVLDRSKVWGLLVWPPCGWHATALRHHVRGFRSSLGFTCMVSLAYSACLTPRLAGHFMHIHFVAPDVDAALSFLSSHNHSSTPGHLAAASALRHR